MAALLLLLLLGALTALLAPSTSWPLSASASAAPSVVEVRLGVLLPGRNLRYPWAWPRVQPALSLALEALESQLRHAGLAVRTVFASTEDKNGTCDAKVALRKVVGLMGSRDADVLLGPGCRDTSLLVSSFAQLWQLPLLRAGVYKRRWDFETTVYAGPVGPHLLKAFLAQLRRHFSWTSRAVLVVNPGNDYWDDYFSLLSSEEDRAVIRDFTARVHEYEQPGGAVRFIQANGRVVYICGSLEMLQEIMCLAQAQNMTSSDYVFIYLDIVGESLRAEGHREAAKPWQSKGSPDTGGLREAFQTVLVVTPHEPQTPEYQHFQSQLILRAQRDFGVALNGSLETKLVAGYFHDVLLLYLRALNETLREGGTKQDTSRILEKMRGLRIQGVTGTMSLNRNNDREMDFDLWAMRDVESGEYQVVAHYVGSEKRIKWLGPIHWKKAPPPLGTPPCVFMMDDPSCGTGAVGSTSQREEVEKYGFGISYREVVVCSGAFSTEDGDLSAEGEGGGTPLTRKKPKMVSALL